MVAMSPNLRYKILLLNGSYDRESDSLTAVDFVSAFFGRTYAMPPPFLVCDFCRTIIC